MKKKRDASMSRGIEKTISSILAIIIALILTGIFIWAIGFDPIEAYSVLIQGAFKGKAAISETVVCAIPLIFSSLGFAVAYQCGIFNIGAGGQLYMGAVFATFVGTIEGMSPAIQLPLTMLAGILGGALWGLVVAELKVKFGANEMITTIMFNYIATIFASYCVAGPMKGSYAMGLAQSDPVASGIRLTRFVQGTRLHTGLFIALILVIGYWVLIWHTSKGYELRVMGMSSTAAQYCGINVKQNVMLSLMLAGGIAGLGGCIEILAIQGKLSAGFAGNIGFDGITVALLGDCTPVGILLSSLLFGALSSGSNTMQMIVGVPSAATTIIQAFIIIAIIIRNVFHIDLNKIFGKREVKQK